MALRTSDYDEKADEAHAPHDKNSVSSNQTSPNGFSFNRGGSSSSLRNKEEGAGRVAPGDNQAGHQDAGSGATDNTGGKQSNYTSPAELNNQEESPDDTNDDNRLGKGFTSSPNSNSTGRKRRFQISRRQAAVGGGIFGTIVGGTLLTFLSLAPLKTEGIIRLLDKYSAASEDAMQTQADNMWERYMVKHVLPDYKRCGTTLSSKCSVNLTSSSNPVTALYKDWADNRIEARLAEKYQIEFKFDRASNRWYLKAPGSATGKGDDIGPNGEKLADDFQRADRAAMRGAFHKGLDGETSWKKVRTYFQVGRLLEEKYGIKRCIAFCGTKDQLDEFKDQKKNTAKIFLAQRVIQPRNEALGIVMECLFGSGCDAQSTQTTTPEQGTSGELEGAPENSTIDTQIRTQLTALAGTYGITDKAAIDKMIKDYQDISEKGYQKYALSKVLEKLGLSQFTDQVADAVPVIGWIDRVSALISNASTLGPNLRKLTYVTNSTAAVSMYMMMRTYMDEIHTGHVDAAEVGSMTSSLNSGEKVGNDDPVGGNAGAEDSPVYRALSGKGSSVSATTTSLNPFSSGTAIAAAAETSPSTYKCENGKPVPSGQLACKEEILGQGSATADNVSSVLNEPGAGFISKAAGVIHAPFATFSNFLGGLLGLVPGVSDLSGLVSGSIEPVYNASVNKLIPNPLGNGNLGGGRKVQVAAAGAKVVGENSCTQIGCQNVDAPTFVNIINKQSSDEWQQFSHKSFLARVFDRSSNYSLVSKMAMSMPSDLQTGFQTKVASIMSNPFGSLFGGMFYHTHAFASVGVPVAAADPFNTGSSAYPPGTIQKDADQYWDENNCGDTSQDGPVARWQKEASDNPKNPNTGMPVYKRTEPCLLIKYTTGAIGGKYNTDRLTPDEQQVLNGGGAASGSAEQSAGGLASGSSKDLAQQLLPLISSGKIYCGPAAASQQAADCPDIQNTANGKPIGGNCKVDKLTPHLLSLLLGLVQDKGWTVGLSAICSDHHPEGDGPYAGHSYGSTLDFSVQVKDGNRASGAAAASNEKFVSDMASLLSTTGGSFGQVGNCHPIYSSQKSKKFTTFTDVCNHQHVRAAP